MITGDSDQLAVRRIFQRGDSWRRDIGRRMLHVVVGFGGSRRVILGSLSHPALDQRDLSFMQRITLRRHLNLALGIWHGHFEQIRLIRLAWHNGISLLATCEQFGKVRHDVVTFGLRWLVTARAIRLKDRADVFVKRHRLARINRLLLLGSSRAERRSENHEAREGGEYLGHGIKRCGGRNQHAKTLQWPTLLRPRLCTAGLSMPQTGRDRNQPQDEHCSRLVCITNMSCLIIHSCAFF